MLYLPPLRHHLTIMDANMSYEHASVMSEVCSRLSYFISLILGLTLNDIAMLVGILTAAGTFLVNWYYKRQHLKLNKERHSFDEAE